MALNQLNFDGKNKIEVAIMRLQEFCTEPYFGSYSGGKDSDTIMRLCEIAGVPVEWHYSQVGIDPPELVNHIRHDHPEVIIDRRAESIFKNIGRIGMPRRKSRWCCSSIKERAGSGRRILTGIRWQESSRRKKRQMVEVCQTDETKIFIHPIIDWTEKDVWEFIKLENIKYCSLYDEGFKRLGCVLCPMSSYRQAKREMERWPKIAEGWRRACYRLWEQGRESTQRWETAEDFWQWWLSRKSEPKVNEAQCIMFDN